MLALLAVGGGVARSMPGGGHGGGVAGVRRSTAARFVGFISSPVLGSRSARRAASLAASLRPMCSMKARL